MHANKESQSQAEMLYAEAWLSVLRCMSQHHKGGTFIYSKAKTWEPSPEGVPTIAFEELSRAHPL